MPRLIALVSILCIMSWSAACPFCNSETGQQVRAAITNDLGANVAMVLMPFPVFVLVAFLARYAVPPYQIRNEQPS